MMKIRITALFVSVFIFLNICAAFAEVESTDYQIYTEAAETMAALGFVQNYSGDDLINKRMTRGEFADIVIKMLNQNTVWTQTQIFTDVGEGHSNADAINTAYSLGLVSGIGGEFKPDDPITFDQAAKILVLALGYRLQAESMGGYPEGYLLLASRLGITKGINAPKNMLLRSGMALQMAFNCLEVDLVEMQISTAQQWEISVAEGANILTQYHNITKGRGVVNKTPISSLTSAARSSQGTVEINGTLYKTGNTDAEDFLGYRVTWYCDSEGTLLFTYCDMRYNEALSVDIKDIIPGSFDSDGEKFSYIDQDGKASQINVSSYADYIYNGVSTGSFRPELLAGEGYVNFIDNNMDQKAEVVMVWSYELMVAESVDKANFKAFAKYGENQVLELEETSNRTVKIVINGQKVNISAIESMDILSVFKSLTTNGYEHIEIVISRETISGKVEWVDDDEDTVGIEEKEYTVSSQIADEAKPVELGASGTFYIDAYGKIAHFEESEYDSFNYGYIIAAGLQGTINKQLQVKLLTINNEIEVFNCDDKLIIDGFRPKTEEDAIRQLTQNNGKCELVVRYKMDENRVLTELDTTASGPKAGVNTVSGVKAEDEDSLRLDMPLTSGSDNARRWIYSASTFGTTSADVILNGNITKVLILPTSDADAPDEIYRFTTRGYFTNSSYYHIACYNVSDYMVADLVVTYEGNPGISEEGKPAMVEKVTKVMNDDGEWVEKVRMIHNGSVVERLTRDAGIADGLKPGDIITFAANNLTEIAVVKKMNFGESSSFGVTTGGSNAGYFYANMNIYYGLLLGKEGNEFLITLSRDVEDKTMQIPFSLSSTKSILYSKKEKTVSVISNEELVNYAYSRNPDVKVVVTSYGGRPSEIFILDYSE